MRSTDRPLIGYVDGYVESRALAAEALPLHSTMDVLDIGIGTGGFSEVVAPHVRSVTGLDISEQMLTRCRAQHPEFALHTGSFTALPFSESRFDLVISSFAFHEVLPPDRPEACAQVFRVLKPGGLLCLLDIIFASPAALEETRTVAARAWDDEEDYPLVGDLDGTLRGVGFRALQWHHVAQGHWAVLTRKA